MKYPCEMWKVTGGSILKMRFKEDAPVGKPNWYETLEEAEKALSSNIFNEIVIEKNIFTASKEEPKMVKPKKKRKRRTKAEIERDNALKALQEE